MDKPENKKPRFGRGFFPTKPPILSTAMRETADQLMRWEFFQAAGDKWGWRRKGTDGYHAQCPRYFVGFGPVLSDAMNHGFSPAHDIWMVEDSNTVCYFSPGDSPRTLRK